MVATARTLLTAAVILSAALPVSAQPTGRVLLHNVGSGLWLGAANDQGTRASLLPWSEHVTLHRQTDGTYTIESQVGTGSAVFFGGEYMDQAQAAPLTLTARGQYYNIAQGNSYLGYVPSQPGTVSGTYLLSKGLSASSLSAQWEIIGEGNFYDYLAKASATKPVDATFLILDQNFGRLNRNADAWVVQASNYNLCGGLNDNKCAESWCSPFTLAQTIALPNGNYVLWAQAALTDYTGIYDGTDYPVVYAGDDSSPFCRMTGSDEASDMSTLSAAFSAGRYEVIPVHFEVSNGMTTIGVRGTRLDTWCTWDNFRLFYYGRTVPVGISDTCEESLATDEQTVFSLSGQRIDKPRKGICIIGGKKKVVK